MAGDAFGTALTGFREWTETAEDRLYGDPEQLADPDTERDPAEVADVLGSVVPCGREALVFEAMARLPHPEVADLLTVLGQEYPDKKTAKLARRAAYKADARRAG